MLSVLILAIVEINRGDKPLSIGLGSRVPAVDDTGDEIGNCSIAKQEKGKPEIV